MNSPYSFKANFLSRTTWGNTCKMMTFLSSPINCCKLLSEKNIDRLSCILCKYRGEGQLSLLHKGLRSILLLGVIGGLLTVVSLTSLSPIANAQGYPKIDLSAIAMIESSNNPKAIGDGGNSLGLYQISRIAFKDFMIFAPERLSKGMKFTDMSTPTLAHKVAVWLTSERLPVLIQHVGAEVTTNTLLIAYNCGAGCLKRKEIPRITKLYIQKYHRLING